MCVLLVRFDFSFSFFVVAEFIFFVSLSRFFIMLVDVVTVETLARDNRTIERMTISDCSEPTNSSQS